MSLSLHTNFAQMLTQNNVYKSNNMMSSAMERLSTGFRINTAADDAAGLQIANRMEAQARGMNVAQRNAQDGVSLLQTAEGALNELNEIGLRMKDLATQSANGTNSEAERVALDTEFQDLKSEFEAIYENTSYGGAKVFEDGLDSTSTAFFENAIDLQIGTTGGASDRLSIDLGGKADKLEEAYNKEQKVVAVADIYLDTDGDGDTTSGVTVIAEGAELNLRQNGTAIEVEDPTDAGSWYALDQMYSDSSTTATVAADDGSVFGQVAGTAIYAGTATGWVDEAGSAVTAVATTDTSVSFLSGGSYDDGTVGSIANQTDAQAAIDNVSTVLSNISGLASSIGSKVNRLGHTMANLGNQEINIENARGRIMDADFASESANFTKYQLLLQAGTSMLSQTGQTSQLALSLLR